MKKKRFKCHKLTAVKKEQKHNAVCTGQPLLAYILRPNNNNVIRIA